MLDGLWMSVVKSESAVVRSAFFFLLVAQCTQFFGCVIFSCVDLARDRVPLRRMIPPAANAMLGFVPFLAMDYLNWPVFKVDLPTVTPSAAEFVAQFLVCGIAGDLLHYWTHRALHTNHWLRRHVHSVHHKHEGPLYAWVGMQVHPLEVAMITVAIYTPLILFAHPMVVWVFAFLATMNATVAHSGYHGGFAALGVPFALSTDDHQMHHEFNSTKNFGNILQVWDKMFGTYGVNVRFPAQKLW